MMAEFFTAELLRMVGIKLLRIGGIVVAALFLQRITSAVIDRYFVPARLKALQMEERRAQTLTEIVKSIVHYSIYFIALVAVLAEFNIDTTSLIAGAGVIGLALGIGAQSLIRDFVTGMFIILEDQYAIGDYVTLGDMAGKVEDVSFRVTRLRDNNGVLHFIPNGGIGKVSNHTRAPLQATVNIPVSQEADIDLALELITKACEAVKDMPTVVEAPKILGIVEYRQYDLIVRVIAKTVPLEQSTVETALRYNVKRLFAAAKIPLPPYREEVKP